MQIIIDALSNKSLLSFTLLLMFCMASMSHAMTQHIQVESTFRRAVSLGLKEKSHKNQSRIQSSGLDTGAAFLQALYIRSTGPVEIVEEHEASHLFVVFN